MFDLGVLRAHGNVISFGFLLAFLSSLGQTYFIALSVPDLQRAFGLSHGEIGGIFSLATLASGFLMVWAGSALDRIHLGTYAALSLAGIGCAAIALTLAPTVWFLALAILALRLFGQGTLSHAAVTSTARLPKMVRGRAIGLASLGFQAGGALFPPVGIAMIASLGWEATWRIAGGAAVLLALLAYRNPLNAQDRAALPSEATGVPRYRARTLMTDPRFLIFVPAMLGPAAVSTGYFFHQRLLAETLGWGLEGLALGVALSAVTSVVSSLGFGVLVDRYGARSMSRIFLLPLAAASLVLPAYGGVAGAAVFFILMGMTSGANGVVLTALLAELFGTEQIATVRAVAASVMVIASALTPFLMGYAFDAGIGIAPIGVVSAVYLVAATLLNIRATVRF